MKITYKKINLILHPLFVFRRTLKANFLLWPFLSYQYRFYHFLNVKIRFNSGYTMLESKSNQYDWNKLTGFASINPRKNSFRLVYRFNVETNKMEINLYGHYGEYVDKKFKTSNKPISLDLNKYYEIKLYLNDGIFYANIYDENLNIYGRLIIEDENIKVKDFYLISRPYFGGDDFIKKDEEFSFNIITNNK